MLRRYASDSRDDGQATYTPAPGRVPATARVGARAATPIVFRVESAEAAAALADRFGPRDGNGVAADAEVTVRRAAGSTGAPLPTEVRERFEQSLGSDLSDVRVHTGDASAEAAAAVGARAYTIGNDIHFGAGSYAPTDPFGIHLLAHEVAHTQQQAGGAPTTQYKLAVSTPVDAAELEADRAADAMVVGAPTLVGRADGGAARKVMRDAAATDPDAVSTSVQYMKNLQAEAAKIAQDLAASPALAMARAAQAKLGAAKKITSEIGGVYAGAQKEACKAALKLAEHDKAMKELEASIVSGALEKVLGLVVGGVAEKFVGPLGDAGVEVLKWLLEKGVKAATEAVTDKTVGKPGAISDTALPDSSLLQDIASAKELWAANAALVGVVGSLAEIGQAAAPLAASITANAGALDSKDKDGKPSTVSVPDPSGKAKSVQVAPLSIPEIEKKMDQLRGAGAAAIRATDAAGQLLATATALHAELVAIQAVTTPELAYQNIWVQYGGPIEGNGGSVGTIDKTPYIKAWQGTIGKMVTTGTECSPKGTCIPEIYPALPGEGMTKPTVMATVGKDMPFVAAGATAKIIAVLDAGVYTASLLIAPVVGADGGVVYDDAPAASTGASDSAPMSSTSASGDAG
ncbi:MAG: DUF4157 domain-containing protein [Deltaproteobacteria bacterium]|nr:DUF4157 domain-containing protein [Deltaproteobacteria bacterium]